MKRNISYVTRIVYKLPRAVFLLSFCFPLFRLFLGTVYFGQREGGRKMGDKVDIVGVPQPQDWTKIHSLLEE